MQNITPFLWFNDNAEEAATFYTSVFPDAKIIGTTRYDAASAKASGRKEGSAMTVQFQLRGQEFTALNGGPVFHLTPAISFVIHCETQEEIDHYWNALSAVPQAEQCGWLQDKYGVSWQVVPAKLAAMIADEDDAKAHRVMQAMLQMKKLDLAVLEAAYDG